MGLSIKDVRKKRPFLTPPPPVRKCPTWPTPPPCGRPQIRGRGWPIYAYITLISSVSQVFPKRIWRVTIADRSVKCALMPKMTEFSLFFFDRFSRDFRPILTRFSAFSSRFSDALRTSAWPWPPPPVRKVSHLADPPPPCADVLYGRPLNRTGKTADDLSQSTIFFLRNAFYFSSKLRIDFQYNPVTATQTCLLGLRINTSCPMLTLTLGFADLGYYRGGGVGWLGWLFPVWQTVTGGGVKVGQKALRKYLNGPVVNYVNRFFYEWIGTLINAFQ